MHQECEKSNYCKNIQLIKIRSKFKHKGQHTSIFPQHKTITWPRCVQHKSAPLFVLPPGVSQTFQRSNYNYSSKQSENNRLNAIKLFISGKFHALNRPSAALLDDRTLANDVCFNNSIDSSPTRYTIYHLWFVQLADIHRPGPHPRTWSHCSATMPRQLRTN